MNENATSGNLWSNLLSNDTEYDAGDTIVIGSVNTAGTQGTVTFNAGTQTLTYAADAFDALDGYSAPATALNSATTSFTYTVDDGHVASPPSGTVNITIFGQNDAPVAEDDAGSTAADTVLTVPASNLTALLQNDRDVDNSAVIFVSTYDATSTAGALVTVNADGSYTYDPTGVSAFQNLTDNQTATDTFTYTVSDGLLTDTGTVTITVTGADEGGSAIFNADAITCGETVEGGLSPSSDEDYYRLVLSSPSTVTITTRVWSQSTTRTTLYNSDGNELTSVNGKYTQTLTRSLDTGIWYIRIDDSNNIWATPYYQTSITCTAGDAGDSCPATFPITCGTTTSAAIDSWGDVDYYKLDLSLASGPTDVVIYTTGGTNTVGEIQNAECNVTVAYNNDISYWNKNFKIEATLDPGVYNVKVRDYYHKDTGNYDLHVTCSSDDYGDNCAGATPIGCGSSLSASIEDAGDADYFKLVLPEGRTVTLTSGGTTNVKATLYEDDCSSVLASADDNLDGTNFSITQALAPGIYYLAVRHSSGAGTGAYTLNMSCTGGAACTPWRFLRMVAGWLWAMRSRP